MIINGKERGFLMTVGASADMAELCPDGDLSKIGEMLSNTDYSKQAKTVAKIVAALSRGFEENKEFTTGEKADPISVREVMALPMDEFQAVTAEAFAQINKDRKTTVEVESKKKEAEMNAESL